MNKLGKREYTRRVAEALCREYGSTLREYGTDIKMAEKVIDILTPYLFFHPHDMSIREWNKWKSDWENNKIEVDWGLCLECSGFALLSEDNICNSCKEERDLEDEE